MHATKQKFTLLPRHQITKVMLTFGFKTSQVVHLLWVPVSKELQNSKIGLTKEITFIQSVLEGTEKVYIYIYNLQ